MKPYVIAGATGHTGRVVAETLLEKKQPVRVLVRSAAQGDAWKKKGAEAVVASLDDEAALTKALANAAGAYLLSPPKVDPADWLADRNAFADVVARAVKAAAVPHVVFLSSVGAHLPSGTGPIRTLHHVEKTLTAPSVTFVRPSYFFDNWGAVVPAAKGDGVLPTFTPPSLAFPQIATKDIGVVAARELLAPHAGRKVVEIYGFEASPADVAQAFAKALGRDVKPQHAPNAAVVPAFTSMGMGASIASLYAEMYDAVEKGRLVFEGKPEKTPTSLDAAARALL